MCRFAGFLGSNTIPLANVLLEPKNSLIAQSKAAKQSEYVVNADGFGVAWYDHSIDKEPAVFKSIQPAWNDNNLQNIAHKLKSNCFLAHIRASTVGEVAVNNCHPFIYKNYAFVHNGTIFNFDQIRKNLINLLDLKLFNSIKAQTDTEHLFFLIMHFMHSQNLDLEASVMAAYKWIIEQQKLLNADSYAQLNILISDGKQIVATRFTTKKNKNLTLYYALGNKLCLENQDLDILQEQAKNNTKHKIFIISSEPLSAHDNYWQLVPENSILVINKAKNFDLTIHNINLTN